MAPALMRSNGLQLPFSPQQLSSWGIFTVDVAVFTCFCIPLVDDAEKLVIGTMLGVVSILLLAAVTLTTWCDATDPIARRQGITTTNFGYQPALLFCNVCNSHVLPMSKHCLRCNRCVHIFCHHEEWVNNCIGDRNYRPFIAALGSVTAGTAIIVGSCVYILIRYVRNEDDTEIPVLAFVGVDRSFELVPAIIGSLLMMNIPLLLLELKGIALHVVAAAHCLTLYEYLVGQQKGWSFAVLRLRFAAIREERSAAAALSKMPGVSCITAASAVSSFAARLRSTLEVRSAARARETGPPTLKKAGNSGHLRMTDIGRFVLHGLLLPLHIVVLLAIYVVVIASSVVAGTLVSAAGTILVCAQTTFCIIDVMLCFRSSARLLRFRLETGECWLLNVVISFLIILAGPYVPFSVVGVFLADIWILCYRSSLGKFCCKGNWPVRVPPKSGLRLPWRREESLNLGIFTLSNLVSMSMMDYSAHTGRVELAYMLFWVLGVQPDPTTLRVATEKGHASMIPALLLMSPRINKDGAVDVLEKIPDMAIRIATFRALVFEQRGWFKDHTSLRNKLDGMVSHGELDLTFKDVTNPVFQMLEASSALWTHARDKAANLECVLLPEDAEKVEEVLIHGCGHDPRCEEVIKECLNLARLHHVASTLEAVPSSASGTPGGADSAPLPTVIGRSTGSTSTVLLGQHAASHRRESLHDVRVWYLVGGEARFVLSAAVWRPVFGKPPDRPRQDGRRNCGIEVLFLAESEAVQGARFAADLGSRLECYAYNEKYDWLCASAAPGEKAVELLEQEQRYKRVVSTQEVAARRLHGHSVWFKKLEPLLPSTVLDHIDEMLRSPFGAFRQTLLEEMYLLREAPLYVKLGVHISWELTAAGVSKSERKFLNSGEVHLANDEESDIAL